MNDPSLPPVAAAFLYAATGLCMLFGGGEILVSGAVRLARHLGMSTLVIGLTVVAFGTSAPELFVSLSASLHGRPDIMIGNIVGSNIANIGLILGISALLKRLPMNLEEVWTELLIVILGSIFLMFCAYAGRFPRPAGLVFVVILISYTCFTFRNHKNGKTGEDGGAPEIPPSILLPAAMIAGGLILLTAGSEIFITGAAGLARHFGVSELVIGLTLAAIGTSLPELASSISAIRRNESGMLIGNVIGSNMFNLFLVMGLTGMITPFSLPAGLLYRDLPVMLAFAVALVAVLRHAMGTHRWHGALFLGGYLAYCITLL